MQQRDTEAVKRVDELSVDTGESLTCQELQSHETI